MSDPGRTGQQSATASRWPTITALLADLAAARLSGAVCVESTVVTTIGAGDTGPVRSAGWPAAAGTCRARRAVADCAAVAAEPDRQATGRWRRHVRDSTARPADGL